MELLNKIQAERLQARKSGEKIKSDLLTTIVGEFETLSKKGKPLNDSDLVALLKKFKANAQETLNIKNDENIIQEITILDSYLPNQMTEDELKTKISEIISAGNTNIGAIMGELKKKYAGLYDGSIASRLVKELV